MLNACTAAVLICVMRLDSQAALSTVLGAWSVITRVMSVDGRLGCLWVFPVFCVPRRCQAFGAFSVHPCELAACSGIYVPYFMHTLLRHVTACGCSHLRMSAGLLMAGYMREPGGWYHDGVLLKCACTARYFEGIGRERTEQQYQDYIYQECSRRCECTKF